MCKLAVHNAWLRNNPSETPPGIKNLCWSLNKEETYQNIGKRYLQTTHNFVINKPFKASLSKETGTNFSLFLLQDPPPTFSAHCPLSLNAHFSLPMMHPSCLSHLAGYSEKVCCAQHLTSLTNWKTWRKVSENSATKKHIQYMHIH
ncbi:hypothetical protein PROFUN_16409 [Planoprotostelium fungivorum]|uniref:Uncharacterized protein n=1 Tax=Planoprotostelium fungivorum TaxID=1890364 RepID=A0A2P6MQQ1_9EUKA|nr:hypothetical protein PROFUN_16409 [Planoprotostelium fungivorum]